MCACICYEKAYEINDFFEMLTSTLIQVLHHMWQCFNKYLKNILIAFHYSFGTYKTLFYNYEDIVYLLAKLIVLPKFVLKLSERRE